MSFLYPSFLYALAAIAIPIIIHLFNFQRYKTILFTNVRFLKEVKQQTRQQAQLKHLLILLSRILFIVFLVLAFAQPFIPLTEDTSDSDHKVSIFLDNSFSMDATNTEGRLFDQARNRVLEIASAYKPTDQFQLLTNDFEAHHQVLVNAEELKELLDQITISPSVKPISQIIARQKDLLGNNPNTNNHSYIVSDFQEQNTDLENITSDSTITVRMVPLTPQDENNIYIDSCWFESPVREANKPDLLMARVQNLSDQDYENIPIKLMVNNQQKALANFRINARSFTDVALQFQLSDAGIKHCMVSITDHPITFDDTYYLSYRIAANIVTTSISDSSTNPFIESFFGKDPQFVLSNETARQIDYSKLPENHLIILNELETISSGLGQELGKFTKNGGSLMVFPGATCELSSYTEFLEGILDISSFTKLDTQNSEVIGLNLQHGIFKDVFEKIPKRIDLPKVKSHYVLTRTLKGEAEQVAALKNGDPLITANKSGKGMVFLFAVPLTMEFSNLPEHALFVPIAYNIAIQSLVTQQHAYTIGKDNLITVRNNAEIAAGAICHLTNWSPLINRKVFDIIPDYHINGQNTTIAVHGTVKEAGNYELGSDDGPLAGISFNFDRRESGLLCFDGENLEELIDQFNLPGFSTVEGNGEVFSHSLSELNEGRKLWKLCIIFALAFLGIEILLLRFWK